MNAILEAMGGKLKSENEEEAYAQEEEAKTGLLAGGPLFRTTAMFSATMPPEARAMSYATP